MTLQVALLGPLEVSVDGRTVELPAGRLPALLATLAMSARETVSADRLAAAVWGEESAVDARTNLQSNVRRLRRVLGAERIVTRGSGYALEVEPDRVDALRFDRLVRQARAAPDRAVQRDLLAEALALWRGAPFDGVRSDWLEHTHAPRLTERYLAALERRIDLDLADASPACLAELAAELGELVGRHPLRESLWVRLLVVLQRSGRAAEALERYETLRRRLAEELGADPGPELRQLHADLLAGRTAAPPGGAPPASPRQAPASPPHRFVPRQLPADTETFTGRDAALKTLDGLLDDEDAAPPRPVVVAVITGTAGVGKTTLAVHWAHRVAGRFPDGHLYVNLRGFDPAASPLQPAAALQGFLEALQVPPQAVPASPEAQAGLYRSLLAGKRMLVLLDNARDADQVRPLLPGTPGCLVLVTSRNQLPGLLAAGGHPVVLDLLDRGDAVDLLARRLSHDLVAAEPDAADELVSRCAGLPLALAIVAARAASRPQLPLAALAEELRRTGDGDGLDGFFAGDTTTDARAVFSWSYRGLSAPAARLFRLLGLHPGPEVTAAAAASLAGLPAAQVRPLLAELAGAHLVTEHAHGRYAMHDLLRAYAGELAHAHERDAERRSATHRMLDCYLHTAHAADLLLYPHGAQAALAPPQSGVTVERLGGNADRHAGGNADGNAVAMAWFAAEHRVLLAAVDLAARGGFHRHTCHLARALSVFLHRRGLWQDRADAHETALDAARKLGDQSEEARAHGYLAAAYADLGRDDDAHRHFDRALELFGSLGDLTGQAQIHYERNLVLAVRGRDAEALQDAQEALRLFEAAGDQVGQASALTDVGWCHGRLGNHQEALRLLGEALDLHRELGNRVYQAHTWSCLAETHTQLGDTSQAIACLEQALDLFRAVGDRYGQASSLARLGTLHHRAGNAAAARATRREAETLLGELDLSAASQLRAALHLDR